MNEKKPSNPWAKSLLIWVGILFGLVVFVQMIGGGSKAATGEAIPYSEFVKQVDEQNVQSVTTSATASGNQVITGKLANGQAFRTTAPKDAQVTDRLISKGVQVQAKEAEQSSFWLILLYQSLPFLLILGISFFVMRQMQKNAGSGAMGFGKSRARMLTEKQGRVTFADVAGIDEAREELQEIVEFLKDPGRFARLGGKIPKGALLVGSPGTGKTLLARAIAGEAGVPFFTISGSDFVEMFVGVGAIRVRDMFDQAKKSAPCIVFIDEIDAVGRHRGAGLGNGNDEREQTLNQLLVEMDGFEANEGIIIIAATNRPDVLDPALLRPGRFDRQVVVPLPDVRGREQILKVHMRKLPLAEDVKPQIIARGTPGFSGADLANLVNEAALFAARANRRTVTMDEFERAKDKIMMGAERRSMVMDEQEKKLTAYHEAGHAIVGLSVPEHDPVYKVTIIPRGRALGVTMFLPETDRYSISKRRLESKIATLFGGRLAEEIIFGVESVTTGASNDIERATEIARNMVTKWGLSDKLGPLTYTEDQGEVFLGRSVTQHKQVSDVTAHVIDEEVRRLIDSNYQRAKNVLESNLDKLHKMAEALIKYETIDESQLKDIMEGRDPKPPAGWDDSPTSTPGGGKARDRDKPEAPIGKPASQH
ncbi:MAG TPA: ATP-dependent zinc metalloprotease FtsH [Sphingomicrobium sp.]|nr:ATP-dependent zinc metalloprotease FtsH [Sphingomicrobium sp.]